MKRFLKILAISFVVAIASLVLVRFLVASQGIDIGIHGQIAIAIGVFFSMLLGFGLMTLLFISNSQGHDEVVYTLQSNRNVDNQETPEKKD